MTKFLFPLIGLISGIFISSECFPELWFSLVCIGIALTVWSILTIISKNPAKGIKYQSWHNLWIILLFTGIGAADYVFNKPQEINSKLLELPLECEGNIEEIRYSTNGDRFIVSLDKISGKNLGTIEPKNVKVLLNTDGFVGTKGDVIRFKGILRKIISDNLGTIHYSYLIRQGISLFSNIKYSNIEIIGRDKNIGTFFAGLKDNLIISIENSSLQRDTAEFLISILLGDKSLLSMETRQTLTSAGMAHILALSGMHVAIILSIVLTLLFPLSLQGHHNIRRILAICIIWIYVIFTGCYPSTVRAALMATFLITAILLERKNSALNALFASVFIILAANPYYLWDTGLQLSFICVASILLFTSKFNPIDRHKHPATFKIVNIILISIITTACTWTLVSHYFGFVPLMFLPSNFLLLPLLPFFVATGLFYIVMLSLGVDLHLMATLLDKFQLFFIGGADILSFPDNLQMSLPSLSVILWLAGILILVYTIHCYKQSHKYISLILAGVTFFFSVYFPFLHKESDNTKIRFVHNFSQLEVHLINSGSNSPIIFPRNTIAKAKAKGQNIISIDCKLSKNPISFENEILSTEKNILFIGANADLKQISELINSSIFHKVILHTGIGKNQKEELMSYVEEEHWDKIQSLRDLGTLELN